MSSDGRTLTTGVPRSWATELARQDTGKSNPSIADVIRAHGKLRAVWIKLGLLPADEITPDLDDDPIPL